MATCFSINLVVMIYDGFSEWTHNWKFSYELTDKAINTTGIVDRTSSFRNGKWVRTKILSRDVTFFGVSRTLPATEKMKLSQCASAEFKYDQSQIECFGQNVISSASKVLGKDLSKYSQINIESDGTIFLLKGETDDGNTFSEFHFGAGESSIIRMICKIESLEDNALILIEEIENGLHPIATQRMVEYLIEVSKRKKIQTVFTTHSNDALMPLPTKAIWSTINNRLFQGRLDVKSLRVMNGQVEASLAIFVEDEFAKMWIEAIMSENSVEDEIEIHAMGGDGNAVSINKHNNSNPLTKCKSICIIDGDSQQIESDDNKVYRLPGQSPERYVFDKVFELIENPSDSKIGELSLMLQKKYEDGEIVLAKIKEINITCRDPHLLFSQIGKSIGFISESVVKGAFLRLWSRYHIPESQKIFEIIQNNISTH
jgi:hypothetical protein